MAMDPAEAASHVKDDVSFHLPLHGEISLRALHWGPVDVPSWSFLGWFEVPAMRLEFQITKFMVLEGVAAILMIAIFVPLAWRIRTGERLWSDSAPNAQEGPCGFRLCTQGTPARPTQVSELAINDRARF